MKRGLQWLNFAGVLALAALCAAQWQRDRRLNLQVNQLERARHEQEKKLQDQEKLRRGAAQDLTSFKDQFRQTHADLTETRARLREVERENEQLIGERNRLESSLADWMGAVAARDEQLKVAEADLREMSARLSNAVQRFNELATNHNASIRRFNELTSNYNAAVKSLNEMRARDADKPSAPAKDSKPH